MVYLCPLASNYVNGSGYRIELLYERNYGSFKNVGLDLPGLWLPHTKAKVRARAVLPDVYVVDENASNGPASPDYRNGR